MLIIINDCFHIAPYSTLEHSLQFMWFTLFLVQAGSFELSIIHWTLTETTGSLACVCDLSAPVYAQGTPVYSLIQKIFVDSSQNAMTEISGQSQSLAYNGHPSMWQPCSIVPNLAFKSTCSVEPNLAFKSKCSHSVLPSHHVHTAHTYTHTFFMHACTHMDHTHTLSLSLQTHTHTLSSHTHTHTHRTLASPYAWIKTHRILVLPIELFSLPLVQLCGDEGDCPLYLRDDHCQTNSRSGCDCMQS